MSHPRTTIIDSCVAIIKDKTLAGKNVFKNKMTHPFSECLPGVIVYSKQESVEEYNQAPRAQKRILTVNLECFVALPDEAEASDQLDDLAWQIEKLLADSDTWQNDCVNDQMLVDVYFEYREIGEEPIAFCKMAYEVDYRTELPESFLTQNAANATDLTKIQGVKNTVEPSGTTNYGINLIEFDSEPDNVGVIDKEFIIETL